MKTQKILSSLGTIVLEEKEYLDEDKLFVGAIRLCLYPNLPKKEDMTLKCFSLDYPGRTSAIKHYQWLFSWYKDGRNVNETEILKDREVINA